MLFQKSYMKKFKYKYLNPSINYKIFDSSWWHPTFSKAALIKSLVGLRHATEAVHDKKELILFDRGTPDHITYFRAVGLDPEPLLPGCKLVRYSSVFHFDLLPEDQIRQILVDDPIRTEGIEMLKLLDIYLERDYQALGYDVIRVPFMSIENRADFVSEKLKRSWP